MKNNGKSLMLLLVALIINISVYSQSKISTLRIEFKLDTSSAVTTVDEPGRYKDASRFDVIFHLDVSKIKGIFGVEVAMGSTDGGSEYFSYAVNTDVQNFSQSVYIVPRKKEIVIDTGKYELSAGPYYAQARLRYKDGTYSAWKKEDAPSPRAN